MGIIDSFFSLNIQKLFMSGRADKAYFRMYNVAEKLAVHEIKLYQSLLIQKMTDKRVKMGKNFDPTEYFDKVVKYRQERLQHHIEEMKSLLMLREEVLKEQAKPKS